MSNLRLSSSDLALVESPCSRDEQTDVHLEKEEYEDDVFEAGQTGKREDSFQEESSDIEEEESVEELSKVILTFQFDSCTESKHLQYEQTLEELQQEVSYLKGQLECLKCELSKDLKQDVQEQLNAIKVKDARLDEKEAHMSKQLVKAVAASVNALVNSGHLVRTDTLMTDPLFKSQVEQVILTHLLQYNRIVDKVVERSLQMVDDMFNREMETA